MDRVVGGTSRPFDRFKGKIVTKGSVLRAQTELQISETPYQNGTPSIIRNPKPENLSNIMMITLLFHSIPKKQSEE